ncbi:MAG: hypothetical protein RIC56_15965 [Pseudomonadales bacterium]
MHTHLKGRIFSSQGVSYLVLHEDCESAEWLRVRALDPTRRVERMRPTDILRCLPDVRSEQAS